MRVVVLAGGLGTRLQEETDTRPKPMVEIGGRPILWHIMKLYGSFGLSHFVVVLGYKGDVIKSYFLDYRNMSRDLSVNTSSGETTLLGPAVDHWTVDLIDTVTRPTPADASGGCSPTFRRRASASPTETADQRGFGCIDRIPPYARSSVTLMAVRPPARFGWIEMEGSRVVGFVEKPDLGEGWVNGGFMVLRREVLDYISSDEESLELDVISRLVSAGEVMACRTRTSGIRWTPSRTSESCAALWDRGAAPWRLWK